MKVAIFTFNDFSENTYILYDESKECLIIDPGCNDEGERNELTNFIENNHLKPVGLLNTHCHIDHVLGNQFVSKKYDLPLESHKGEEVVLKNMVGMAQMYGIPYQASPPITVYLNEGDTRTFGESQLEILFTPGHSPASISFYHRESKQLIAGDVLFQGSIGRTDLPGGNFDTLIASIKNKYYPLGDEVVVYPGHGPLTTVGEERRSNPFLTGGLKIN
jgi:glyoxylase-like metal-dependent hydrolase (beta-lactamase superfamily II)